MKTWTSAIALMAAGTMLVGSAYAQGTTPSGDSKDKNSTGASTSDTTKSDVKSPDTSPSAGAAKPDMKDMKDMKSDMKDMKSKMHKSGMAGGMARGGHPEHVKAVQQALKDKGHDPGMIDGKMGPRTQAALKDYQSKEGLKATGSLDSETMTKLGVDAKTSASGSSSDTSASTGSSTSSPAASPKTDAPATPKADSSASPKTDAPATGTK